MNILVISVVVGVLLGGLIGVGAWVIKHLDFAELQRAEDAANDLI